MGSARPAIRHPPSTPAFPIRVSAFYLLPTPDISSTHSLPSLRHFRLVVYHFLLGMAVLSLYRASSTHPGTPDPLYAQPPRPPPRPVPESTIPSPLLGSSIATDSAHVFDRPASPIGVRRASPAPGLRRRDSDTPRPPADFEARQRGRSGSISFTSGTSAGVFPRVYADERRGSLADTAAGEDDVPLSALRRGDRDREGIIPSPYTSPYLGFNEETLIDRFTEPPISPRMNGEYPPPPPLPALPKREDDELVGAGSLGRENKLLRRWCGECQGWKPPRCHHCRSCGVCILKVRSASFPLQTNLLQKLGTNSCSNRVVCRWTTIASG